MIAWLAPLILRTGIPARFAKAASWVIIALLAALAAWAAVAAFRGWVADGKDEAVALNQKDVTIEAANRVINATSAATANQMERDEAFDLSQQELRNAAVTQSTDDSVGPGVTSVLDRMREQQAAGRRR